MIDKALFSNRVKNFFTKQWNNNVFYFLTAFLLLFVQSDAFLFNLGEKYRIIEYLILGIWFIVLFVRLYFINDGSVSFLKTFQVRVLIIPFVIVLLSFFVNINYLANAHRHVFILFHLALSPIVLFSFDLKKLFQYFLSIFLVFCVISDIICLIDRLNPNLLSFLPVFTNKAYTKFWFYGFGFLQAVLDKGVMFRNSGLFREPGVYGVFLIICLVMLFSKKFRYKKPIWNILSITILSITAITTFSTTTLICLALVFFLFLFKDAKFNRPFTYVKIVLLVSFIIAFLIISITQPAFVNKNPLTHALFSKIFNKRSTSFYNRLYDSVSSLMATLRNPVVGNGWGLHDVISSEFAIALNAYTSGGINSFFTMTSVYGIFFGSVVIFAWFLFCFNIFDQKLFPSIFAFVTVFVVLACEDLTNNFLFLFIPYCTFTDWFSSKFEFRRNVEKYDWKLVL